ncbi:MAG: hypothetical protein NT023_14150 [Armatimonadetes bacterium]|nr:hypothetical protein [Armatimonadota bacterium]
MQKRVITNQYLLRLQLPLVLASILLLLLGCGIGNGFTGGGVPIGRAVIIGQAVSATAPNTPIANALVYVSVSTNTRVIGTTLTTTTDSNGKFKFSDIPVETAPTSIRVAVDPQSSSYVSQQILFKLDKDKTANLIVTLAPYTLDLSSASTLILSPSNNFFATNIVGKVNAQVLDSQGNTLQLTPSLLLIGDFSSIQANGTFTASQEQVGTVEAFWYNNLQASGTVSVQSNGDGSPPPPPSKKAGVAPALR